MNRIKSGVIGLDELIGGGFPEGRTILVTGACGTGKTIFCMQFIHEGAAKYNEPGIYVTMDERPNLIREDVMQFGWDLRKLEEKNLVHIIDGSVARIGMPSEEEFSLPMTGFDLDKLLLEIMRVTKRIGAKRVVIDSIPALGFNFNDENEVRKAILKLSYMLMRIGVTSLLTSEVQEGANRFGRYEVEEYVVDGVIVLHYSGIGGGGTNRTLHIRKLRATKHSEDLHPLTITAKGIKVHPLEEVYKEG
ncbi:MAG: ATPase domain-containing protein [Candidatus Diapherotrites archaeon]